MFGVLQLIPSDELHQMDAWDQKLDDEWQEWKKKLRQLGQDGEIDKFMSNFRDRKKYYTVKVHPGSFNYSIQVKFNNGE
ncbi:hypothetical protein GP486_006785 [Trichoglossum hirsutum]|uniref:Uncharacterized protein n=1 Tax=Trichoglossum hirsutum TaxID=265104 RepID=A0A9P8L3D4_9PEZI|nr:hypothetical protein GP486_006785 [Trichoglossum hirsutum]